MAVYSPLTVPRLESNLPVDIVYVRDEHEFCAIFHLLTVALAISGQVENNYCQTTPLQQLRGAVSGGSS